MEADTAFATKCARAREAQADLMDDRVLEVTNKAEAGQLAADVARVVLSGLQWRASKLQPKKYGDSQTLRHADADGNKIQAIVNVTIAGT